MSNSDKAGTARVGKLSGKSLLLCLLRSSMVNTAYSLRGLQSMGFTYSIMPGLRDIYSNDADFIQGCLRYAPHHNCHPFWGPFLTGAFLHTELRVASGQLNPDLLKPLKNTTLNSLSALGDSFFSGSVEAVAFLFLCCMVVKGYFMAALVGLCVWIVLAMLLKVGMFFLGIRRGIAAVGMLRSLNLINLGDYIKIFGSLVLVAFLSMSLFVDERLAIEGRSFTDILLGWVMPVISLLVMGALAERLHYSRVVMISLLLLLVSTGVLI